MAQKDETTRRLMSIPGVGPITASAIAARALSRSRVLLVNREARSKTAWRKINDLGNSLSVQIPSKIAYSWPV
jgi:transposase